MQNRAKAIFTIAMLICLLPAAGQALTPYSQDFESLWPSDPYALALDGWLVFGNVSSPGGTYLYGYGPFPAPNEGLAFCGVATGQGGPQQGDAQLVVYSDYQNFDHAVGNIIESNVYQEQTIEPENVGQTWVFDFQAKFDNLEGSSTAAAFIKTVDPNAGHALTNNIMADMTSTPITWTGYTLSIVIDSSLEGQLLQIGFLNTATFFEGSGIFYDNVDFYLADPLVPYSQDFEGLVQTDPDALADEGWQVFGNVFTPDETYLYGYGPFPAPNNSLAFCQLVVGQGGPDQGDQQLAVFSDYESGEHANGNIIESNIFREWWIGPENVGETWILEFQAKLGDLGGSSTAKAFIKTLDPNAGWDMTTFIWEDMTSTPTTWTDYSLSITIDPTLDGQILQIGFLNTATFYQESGIFYDNIDFFLSDPSDAPAGSATLGATLRQNFPNPFNPKTTISFDLPRPERVDLSIYGLSGQLVRTLASGNFVEAGLHEATWYGKDNSGRAVASGTYFYRLEAGSFSETKRMTLVK